MDKEEINRRKIQRNHVKIMKRFESAERTLFRMLEERETRPQDIEESIDLEHALNQLQQKGKRTYGLFTPAYFPPHRPTWNVYVQNEGSVSPAEGVRTPEEARGIQTHGDLYCKLYSMAGLLSNLGVSDDEIKTSVRSAYADERLSGELTAAQQQAVYYRQTVSLYNQFRTVADDPENPSIEALKGFKKIRLALLEQIYPHFRKAIHQYTEIIGAPDLKKHEVLTREKVQNLLQLGKFSGKQDDRRLFFAGDVSQFAELSTICDLLSMFEGEVTSPSAKPPEKLTNPDLLALDFPSLAAQGVEHLLYAINVPLKQELMERSNFLKFGRQHSLRFDPSIPRRPIDQGDIDRYRTQREIEPRG